MTNNKETQSTKIHRRIKLSPVVFILMLLLLVLFAILAFVPRDTLKKMIGIQPTSTTISSPTPLSEYTQTTDAPEIIVITATPAPQDGEVIAGLIIYSKDDQENMHLYAYQPETMKETKITNGDWDDIHPALSPDGKKLIFSSNRNGYWDLYVLDLVRNKTIKITNDMNYDGGPAWSPDGQWLVFEHAMDNGTIELFLQPIDLSIKPIQLTINQTMDVDPVWHPDPEVRQIAFISNTDGKQDIWILDINKAGAERLRNLTANEAGSYSHVQWADQGNALSWCKTDVGQAVEIFSFETNLTTKIALGCEHQWSPDGQSIALINSTGNSFSLSIYTFDKELFSVLSVPIAKDLQGFTWGVNKLSPSIITFQDAAKSSWELSIIQDQIEKNQSHQLIKIESVNVAHNEFSEVILPVFNALRSEVIERTGWDALSLLGEDFIFLNEPADIGEDQSWYYTGRAFGIDQAYIDAGYAVMTKESINGQVYWRIFLKVADENGIFGIPLRTSTFDAMARFYGNPVNYETGGAEPITSVSGYWVDLTGLAARYGFEREAANPEWLQYYPAMNHEIFVFKNGYSWLDAILQLYSEDVLSILNK